MEQLSTSNGINQSHHGGENLPMDATASQFRERYSDSSSSDYEGSDSSDMDNLDDGDDAAAVLLDEVYASEQKKEVKPAAAVVETDTTALGQTEPVESEMEGSSFEFAMQVVEAAKARAASKGTHAAAVPTAVAAPVVDEKEDAAHSNTDGSGVQWKLGLAVGAAACVVGVVVYLRSKK